MPNVHCTRLKGAICIVGTVGLVCIFIMTAFWDKYIKEGTPFPISHKGSMWAREGLQE